LHNSKYSWYSASQTRFCVINTSLLCNQAVPLFLSEIAPTRIRGGLNILFQLNVTIGILFANLVNYGTAK
jgi:hypothetical protein